MIVEGVFFIYEDRKCEIMAKFGKEKKGGDKVFEDVGLRTQCRKAK
jgi:hypothetical protein